MNKWHFFYSFLLLLCTTTSWAQSSFSAQIRDKNSGEALAGATVQLVGSDIGAVADTSGYIFLNDIPIGTHTFLFSFVGYEPLRRKFTIPQSSAPQIILLEGSEELEEIVVKATRGSRTLNDIPTRVEVLGAEELVEKAVMNSTNIAMILRESTGIQMQQTSASSANQSIRIQGLDGRYTQIIQDGFPLYGGFAGGLSIMQIPPLDLQQVEVIKGSASTLYGGGSIAGLINLVTKMPGEEPELDLMLNQTSAGGTTVNGFYANRGEKTGVTLYTSLNRQSPYDPEEDNFSNIPEVRGLTLAPRVFYYFNDNTTLWAGVRATLEERTGGNMEVLKGKSDLGYTEKNLSNRVSSQLQFSREYAGGKTLIVKNSFNFFDRQIKLPQYQFRGEQLGSFTEATYSFGTNASSWITGLNLFSDQFKGNGVQGSVGAAPNEFNYNYITFGAFGQHNWILSEDLVLESGLRTDYNGEHGLFTLPRLSLLYKMSEKISSRIGGGLGYKLPTIFTEDAERLSFQGIQNLGPEIQAEKSEGANLDIHYLTPIGSKASFSLNQLFFLTRLHNSLELRDGTESNWYFSNSLKPVYSKGMETNARFTYHDFKLFLQYAFIDTRIDFNGKELQKPLTARHNAGVVLVFEQEDKWRIGYEIYYTGSQYLSNRTQTPDYWIMGLMALRQFEHFSFFLNFENFLDTRQTRHSPLSYTALSNPTQAEIWAPTDGFVVNGGFIWKLFSE